MANRKEIYPGLRIKIYERDDYKCRYCGLELNKNTISLDHIIPVCLGGMNTPDNLLTACCYCNSKKHWNSVEKMGMSIIQIDKEVVKWQDRRWKTVTLPLRMNS